MTTGRVDCSRCDYTKGQIWLEDWYNCHLYYICEPLGNGVYRVHHVTCGDLFWNQAYHTCVPVMPRDANCKIGPVSPFPPEPTVNGKSSVLLVDGVCACASYVMVYVITQRERQILVSYQYGMLGSDVDFCIDRVTHAYVDIVAKEMKGQTCRVRRHLHGYEQ